MIIQRSGIILRWRCADCISPGILIFTLDITLKYIVLLGNLLQDLLTAVLLRSVGCNRSKYTSVGGVLGVTFLRGTELNRQMVEAMICRGYTGEESRKGEI